MASSSLLSSTHSKAEPYYQPVWERGHIASLVPTLSTFLLQFVEASRCPTCHKIGPLHLLLFLSPVTNGKSTGSAEAIPAMWLESWLQSGSIAGEWRKMKLCRPESNEHLIIQPCGCSGTVLGSSLCCFQLTADLGEQCGTSCIHFTDKRLSLQQFGLRNFRPDSHFTQAHYITVAV